MTNFVKLLLNKFGVDLVRLNKPKKWPADFEAVHKETIDTVRPFTMTSEERIYGLIEAVNYLEKNKIDGDVVECGVWKGGSMLATAKILTQHKSQNRQLYLYDTFEGMPPPTKEDVSYADLAAEKLLKANPDKNKNLVWAYSALDEVKQTMSLSTYPPENIHYIKGKVEETIPQQVPEKIALLRLDTDWYESTRHELIHLYPRLVQGGVLIIDDYGFWKGARKAVDEYFAENNIPILLNRMDETGRIAVK
ncbi:MAG: macrocin O-methyltransferase [Chitinophagaceae bacterium]|nr:MAG: macrocin O-methyltransferase [Chitinophagaceae bacterium]